MAELLALRIIHRESVLPEHQVKEGSKPFFEWLRQLPPQCSVSLRDALMAVKQVREAS